MTTQPFVQELHPELSAAKRMPRVTRSTLPLFRLMAKLPRPDSRTDGVEISDRRVGDMRVRVIRPQAAKPVGALLWLHGGGLILGSPRQDDGRCARFARDLGIVVASPDYRLAPEHPFPSALDDCRAAWQWLQDQLVDLGVDSRSTMVGGESAGAGLAASLTQRLHDEGGPQAAAQLLIYPMLDDRTAARTDLDELDHLVWNNRSNRLGWSAYLGGDPGSEVVPRYAVPARRGDLGGLPPCWIGVGTLDLFLEEVREYARRLQESGVACELHETPGACHGFLALAPSASISLESTDSQLAFMREHLGSGAVR